MNKTFIILMFGTPFEWIDKFIDSVQHLGQYGWNWQIYTPNNIQSKGNVEVIPMNVEAFCDLVNEKTGVKPEIYITENGIPSVHVTDFMVAYGKIFEDYLKCDFWGMMGGPDILFGRLDHFVPDSLLKDCDVFTDEPNSINGCFTLFRNTEEVNTLFLKIHNWKDAFSIAPCPRCTGKGTEHTLLGTDEYGLTEIMKTTHLRYVHPKWYPLHGHDRLGKEIELKEDGSLWELTEDNPPHWPNANQYFGREILFYHFSQTKKWPI